MVIYWSMIAFTAVIALIEHQTAFEYYTMDGILHRKAPVTLAIVWAGYLLFWIGLRSGVGDTPAYIYGFRDIPVGWYRFFGFLDSAGKGKGFQACAFIFKNLVSKNYHAWLFFITFVSLYCVTKVFYEQSDNFAFTAYLFIASCMFTWLLNGIRQFLACAILFLYSDWFAENRRIKYIILILIVSLIHNTALVLIPIVIYFGEKEPWTWKTFLFIILFSVAIFYSDQLLGLFTETEMGKGYADGLENSEGTNIIRTVVAAVPVILAFLERQTVFVEGNTFIKTCVIMSLVSLCFYALSSVTSGVLLGRLPNYFEIYNMVLLPWLIEHNRNIGISQLLKAGCIVMYLLFFIYQMTVAWNLYYISDFTGRIF